MNRAMKLALGSALMLLGSVGYFLSALVEQILFPDGWNNVLFLALVLLDTAVVTLGLFLLVYGAASPPAEAKRAEPGQG